MAHRPRTHPKRRPRQERSRATVEALLRATARVLVREGYARASTNRIAEVAGVNIGSLYQYFPGKEALVAALVDEHLEAVRTSALPGLLASEAGKPPLAQAVRELVRTYLELHRRQPALNKALLEQVPRVERLNPILQLRHDFIAATAAFLRARRAELPVKDPHRAAFVVVHLVDALTQAALLERPEWLEEPEYAEDVAAAVLSHLRRAAQASR